MDLSSILNCKLCLLDCEDLIDITNSTINTFDVGEIIQKHLWLKVCIIFVLQIKTFILKLYIFYRILKDPKQFVIYLKKFVMHAGIKLKHFIFFI